MCTHTPPWGTPTSPPDAASCSPTQAAAACTAETLHTFLHTLPVFPPDCSGGREAAPGRRPNCPPPPILITLFTLRLSPPRCSGGRAAAPGHRSVRGPREALRKRLPSLPAGGCAKCGESVEISSSSSSFWAIACSFWRAEPPPFNAHPAPPQPLMPPLCSGTLTTPTTRSSTADHDEAAV